MSKRPYDLLSTTTTISFYQQVSGHVNMWFVGYSLRLPDATRPCERVSTSAQHSLSPTRLGTVVREQAFTLFA